MSSQVRDPADVEGPLRASLPHVFAGGVLGAAARILLLHAPGMDEWLGVLLANLAGAFALGLLFERLAEHRVRRSSTWAFWGPGVLGAFTTFSALALLTADELRHGAWASGGLYLLGSIALGLAAARLGCALGARR